MTIDEYTRAVRNFDWGFEYADSYSQVIDGREKLAKILLVQQRIDPDATIWNNFANPQYQVKQ